MDFFHQLRIITHSSWYGFWLFESLGKIIREVQIQSRESEFIMISGVENPSEGCIKLNVIRE